MDDYLDLLELFVGEPILISRTISERGCGSFARGYVGFTWKPVFRRGGSRKRLRQDEQQRSA